MLYAIAYLAIGFLAAFIMFRLDPDGYENPAGTLLFDLIGWPILVLLLAFGGLARVFEWIAEDLMGANPSDYDSRGV